jgi:hypothetical protein
MPDENEPNETNENQDSNDQTPPAGGPEASIPAYAANEKISKINVADEIKNSFLDY